MPQTYKYHLLNNLAEVRQIVCRVPKVNKFIQGDLEEALRANECDAYGVYDNERLIAFFALRNDERFENINGEHNAVEISFLVVDREYELRGLGTAIIREISNLIVTEYRREIITVEALVISHPRSERYEAVSFYRKCKFIQAEMYDPSKETLGMYREAIYYGQTSETAIRVRHN